VAVEPLDDADGVAARVDRRQMERQKRGPALLEQDGHGPARGPDDPQVERDGSLFVSVGLRRLHGRMMPCHASERVRLANGREHEGLPLGQWSSGEYPPIPGDFTRVPDERVLHDRVRNQGEGGTRHPERERELTWTA
jgi:hypothetical protein